MRDGQPLNIWSTATEEAPQPFIPWCGIGNASVDIGIAPFSFYPSPRFIETRVGNPTGERLIGPSS